MKVAVSIPNRIFEQAEDQARRLGVSRSELYARALQRLLSESGEEQLTEQLNAVYGDQDSSVPLEVKAAQSRALTGRC